MARTKTTNIYDTITNQIIEALEYGTEKFSLPWHRSTAPLSRPMNAVSKNAYRGVNVLALWASAEAQDFGHGLWATYRQWQSLGAQVRKDEKASPIVFYKVLDKREDQKIEEDKSPGHIFARASHVFNVSQVEGYEIPDTPEGEGFDPIPQAQAFVEGTGAKVRAQGESAHYTPSTDTITMPDRERFFTTASGSAGENWYATLLHELVHWSGADHRLARKFGKRFGDEAYAMEELVAELGSAFLCGDLGLSTSPRPDHASYLASWHKVLKADNRAIFTAASAAAKAADYLQSVKRSGS
ncbi:zincin-like metallopeptidase domain-containing protein [uncultured Erythrobacter sp.]|uniref:ArdC family protein n=1 Tax=uncultured Erythrobacter sp. TaxID=263913 RepID=UPI00261A40A7|nr:zincin-like metallopeptidase domain-containing protein [uncultured Erythrobacter sp.]